MLVHPWAVGRTKRWGCSRAGGLDVVAAVASMLAGRLVGEILNRKSGVMGRNPPALNGQRKALWQSRPTRDLAAQHPI